MIHILNHNDEIIDYFDINDGDILEPDMVRNIETLEDTLEFTVLTERSVNVQQRNRVIIQDNENVYREFIIMQYESNIDGFTTVSCVGSHLEDFASAKPLKPQRLERYTTNQAINFMSADTGWELAPDNEWNGTRTTSWSSWQDRLSLLKQLQTTYDMRLSFYIELGTNTVKHRYVKLKEINPMFNGEEIVYGENMIDLKRSVDFTDVATALVALGPEDDDGNRIIIEEHDDEAQEQLGLPYRYLWQIYEPESDDTKMTEKRLRTLARTKLNKIKEASVSYTIQSTQLDVKVGDMIRVKNEDFTPELYVEAEIIEIKYNAYTKLCDYKFGILTEYTRDEVYEQFNRLLETLRKRLENISHNTENIINERFEEELKDLERYIHKSPSAPLNPKEGDLWLDTSHNQVAVLKRYENGKWIKSSVSEAHDINAPTREEVMYQMITERAHRLKNMMLNNFGTFNNLTNQKYYGDLPRDIRESFSASFTEQSKAYTDFERDYDNIHPEQPTIGLIVQAMDSAIRFEEASLNFNDAYAQIRAAYDSYIELLQRQYSDEKYEEALNEIADKFGLEVVDGKLMGDANFIDNMNEIKKDLQKQLDDARKAFDELEIGGRNLILGTAFREEYDEYTFQRLDKEFSNGILKATNVITEYTSYPRIFYRPLGDLTVGEKYTISFKAKGDIDFTAPFRIADANGTNRQLPNKAISYTEEWKFYSFTFTVNEYFSNSTSIQWWVNEKNPSTVQSLFLKEVQLEKGTVATDWTPAPEDTDNKITNINQSITNIEGQLKSTVNKDTFDLLNETVTKQGTTLSQTAESLKSKADSSRVDTIDDTVTQQGTELSQTAQDLKLKANQKDLDTLSNTVSEQGTEITANAQEISLRAKESDLNTVTGRVDKAEADIEVNAREISSRVKDVDYQTDKEGIIGRLSGAESSLTQQSKLIETKVSSTELTQAIDDIEVGGRNYMLNTSEEKYSGSREHLYYGRIDDALQEIGVGEEIVISFDVKSTNGDYIQVYNSNRRGQWYFSSPASLVFRDLGTEWTRRSFTSTVSFNDSRNVADTFIEFYGIYDTGNTFYIKNVKIEKGNKATDWTPAPEDVDEKIKANEDRIISHDTQFEQTDKQITLRATMTDVNKSDETLSRAISELVIDSANGLKFNYDSNGRLESYSVGRDGIQFDGSKIKFKASDSIMLQISAAQKTGNDAKSKIDNLDVGSENLLPDSGWHKEPAGSYVIPDNWSRAVGGIVWGGRQAENWLLARVNHDADGTRGSTTASYYGLRSPQILEPLIAGQEYTFTFKTRNVSGNNMNYCYTYIIYDESSNQKIFPVFIKDSDNGGQLWSVTFTASSSDTGHILIGHSIPVGSSNAFYLKEPMLYKGNAISSWADSIQNKTDKDKIVASINLDDDGARITGKKIALDGYTTMTQAFSDNLEVNKLVSTSKKDTFTLIGGDVKFERSNGQRMTMAIEGIHMYNSNGSVRFQMDEHMVTTAAMGTSNANVYLGTSNGYEVRFVDRDSLPSDGLAASYSYVDARGWRGYFDGIANNMGTHLWLGADGEVKISNKGMTTLSTLRAAEFHANAINLNSEDNSSNHLYLRTNDEVRVTKVGTTTGYLDIRAGKGYFDSLWSHRYAHLNLRVDNEVRLISHGSTQTYRDIRGFLAYFDALDVNTGSHIYVRPTSGNEARVTRKGTTGTYEDIRFKSWFATSSEKYKTDIDKWDYKVLDILKNDVQLYTYKFKSEVEDGVYARNHHGVIIEREIPIEWRHGDGVDNYEMASWTLKGVQELAFKDDEKNKKISALENKVEKLEQQMSALLEMLQ